MPISGLVYGRGAMCWVHVYVDVWQRKGQINRAINTGELLRGVHKWVTTLWSIFADFLSYFFVASRFHIFGSEKILILSEGAVAWEWERRARHEEAGELKLYKQICLGA